MLIGDFCMVSQPAQKDDSIITKIQWNATHPIFQGHFPGQPVVPGVCMVQLVMEILELALKNDLRLQESSNIKFLHFIDPRVHQDVDMQIKYSALDHGLAVSAVLQKEGLTFFRFQGNYRSV
jgi:3-hydroxyacyl-[acyl-carrier-protein] dehydratase